MFPAVIRAYRLVAFENWLAHVAVVAGEIGVYGGVFEVLEGLFDVDGLIRVLGE